MKKSFRTINELLDHYKTLTTSATFKKVAIYMRVDTEETIESEVAAQREALYTFCARNHLYPILECGEVCSVPGFSNLETLQRLVLESQKEHTWEFILVTDFASIASDEEELSELKSLLASYGIMLLDLNSEAQLKGFMKVERMIKNRFKI